MLNADLRFEIIKQILTRKDINKVVSFSQDFLHARFKITEKEWLDPNLEKYAIFGHEEINFTEKLTHMPSSDEYVCLVPWEILRYDYFTVMVYGSKKNSETGRNYRITTKFVKIPVLKSNFTEDICTTKEPSVDAFTKVYETINNKVKIVNEAPTTDTEGKKGDIHLVVNDGFVTAYACIKTSVWLPIKRP